MIDTHAHIHDPAFDADRHDTLLRARDAGIDHIVTVGCDIADSSRAVATAKTYGLYASVGIHPHEAKDAPSDIAGAFSEFFDEPCVVAVGETGLDYFYDHSPRETQQRVLREQIRCARDRNLPVIFHHRDAYDDFVAILREEFVPGMRGVIHCFTGDTEQAALYREEFNLYLGIGGVLTFKSADKLREAVRTVGLDGVILETDCPYLAPVPHRGERNEPAFVTQTALKLAEVVGISVQSINAQTTRNASDLFQLH
ncbi:MAG: TatD family hydrolase [Candidatus Eremiobacteraeota bacterium]|nr:TatD family hydrolase [Candidatus Eremiobacteraeota bacterium]